MKCTKIIREGMFNLQSVALFYTFSFLFLSFTVCQDTTLALWIPCAALAAFETGLSVWCFIVGLALRGLTPCGNSYIKEQVCVGWGKLEGCYCVCRLNCKRAQLKCAYTK